jgi:hypothetical protein
VNAIPTAANPNPAPGTDAETGNVGPTSGGGTRAAATTIRDPT